MCPTHADNSAMLEFRRDIKGFGLAGHLYKTRNTDDTKYETVAQVKLDGFSYHI
jgi:hypothetical protein